MDAARNLEVEQLHKIYKLCGSPSDEYWKQSKLPNATLFNPWEPYKRCIRQTFKVDKFVFPLLESSTFVESQCLSYKRCLIFFLSKSVAFMRDSKSACQFWMKKIKHDTGLWTPK